MPRHRFSTLTAVFLVVLGCDSGTAPNDVVAFTADPAELFLIVGANAPVRVLGRRPGGSNVELPTRSARFVSANPNVARIAQDSAGLVIADRVGGTTVSVTVDVGSRSLGTTVRVVVGNVVGSS